MHAHATPKQDGGAFGPPNVLTLSCKSRPPHRGSPGGAAAAATNMQWRERTAADVTPAVQFGAARGGSAAGPAVRRLLSACEGS